MKPPAIRIQFDVNVLLDILLDRKPWSDSATSLLSLCDQRVIHGCWCAASVGTLYFLVKRQVGQITAQQVLRALNDILEIAPVDSSVINDALSGGWPDLEDAIIDVSARLSGATHIITRDPKDYSKSTLVVCDAATLLESFA